LYGLLLFTDNRQQQSFDADYYDT